ncbi:MAG: LmbE family protein [Acidobacteria bacterium]|nr:MAG: LmbE family protein [Acidobacteriota bacterium]
MPPSSTIVLALFAHPDDAEFLCAGTLAHLADRGARVHIATMTAGDCGSATLAPEKIARIRQKEATRAAALLGGKYACLGEKDLSVFYDRRTLAKVMTLVRRVSPALVFTHSPTDYMLDHETASRLVQTACFGATAPNYRTGSRGARPLASIPHLYYAEPFGGRDILGNEIRSNVFVNATATFALKLEMLACHESQQAWLRAQQGISDNRRIVQRMAERAGQLAGFPQAEGFRQHLGQGFPHDNLLQTLLGELVRDVRSG